MVDVFENSDKHLAFKKKRQTKILIKKLKMNKF